MSDGIPCMIMRGGTSKGAYFLADDLPVGEAERDDLLMRIMGTPDPRQIDGIGGAHPLTSKVAIVSPSTHPRSDVDYLFLQLGVDQPIVSARQPCGNILAGIGPFAIERGIVNRTGASAEMGIRMVNTDSHVTATFPLSNGMPTYEGNTSISGVPGTSARILLEFHDIAGGTTGSLLPTGSAVDQIHGVECTLIDNGMPVVVMRAEDLGVAGSETCEELEANSDLRRQIEEIRLSAANAMGLGDVTSATIPKMTLVAKAAEGGTLATRSFIPHRCHDAIGVLAAVSVATAAILPGSPAESVASPIEDGSVVLEHPTGSFEASIETTQPANGIPRITRAGIVRTARKLFDGLVYPRPESSARSGLE